MQSTQNGQVEHMPRVLCVADTFPWKVKVLEEVRGKFREVGGSKYQEYLQRYHYGVKHSPNGYVASIGTCRGDSGGPLYMTETMSNGKNNYVVTGQTRRDDKKDYRSDNIIRCCQWG